jgi:hypothetical protein
MNIIAISDIHGSLDYLGKVSEELAGADLVIIAGDITTFGNDIVAGRVIDAIAEYNKNILAVHGNCDLQAVEEYLDNCGLSLDCRCTERGGVLFGGIGGSLPCPGKTPNECGEDTFADCLKKLEHDVAGRPFVFVSHQPPCGTKVDSPSPGNHTGSTVIRDFIDRTRPILAISGHIHEAAGTDMLNGTTLVNPGPFRQGCYAKITIEGNRVSRVEVRSVGRR